jgi:hypothetical protein
MPYIRCPRCGLIAFSVAQWLNADHCARCDAELPRASSGSSRAQGFRPLPGSWPPPRPDKPARERAQ